MNKEKKKFEEPKIEITYFEVEDIITTSSRNRATAELADVKDF